MQKTITVLAVVLGLLPVTGCVRKGTVRPTRPDDIFRSHISGATRLRVTEEYPDDAPTLFEVADKETLRELADNIRTVNEKESNLCTECGCYGLAFEWYKGETLLTHATLRHGEILRSGALNCEVTLTYESAKWITEWLAKNGITEPAKEVEKTKKRRAIAEEANRKMADCVSETFRKGLRAIPLPSSKKEISEYRPRKLEYIRSSLPDERNRSLTLFRILGCLPMRWDFFYEEQREAQQYLEHAPAAELERAFGLAKESKDNRIRTGAARAIFIQTSMTRFGKTEADIARWKRQMFEVALKDSLPENRRMAMVFIADILSDEILPVLEHAAHDPDQTVRRRAIYAMAAIASPKALDILRRISNGDIAPRKPERNTPTDYSKGVGGGYFLEEMEEESYEDTDREAASEALEFIQTKQISPTE